MLNPDGCFACNSYKISICLFHPVNNGCIVRKIIILLSSQYCVIVRLQKYAFCSNCICLCFKFRISFSSDIFDIWQIKIAHFNLKPITVELQSFFPFIKLRFVCKAYPSFKKSHRCNLQIFSQFSHFPQLPQ